MLNKNIPKNEFNAESAENQENFNRQRDKLVGFYLHGGDERYIFESRSPDGQYNERRITQADRDRVLDMMHDEKIPLEEEHNLLMHIAGPANEIGIDGVFRNIQYSTRCKRILGYMTNLAWNEYDQVSGDNIHNFLLKFPTPMEFARSSYDFLRLLAQDNDVQLVKDYSDAMETFKDTMYGKKYEYYKVMKKMHDEAKAMAPRNPNDYGDFLSDDSESYNKEPLIKDAGMAAINKRQAGELKNNFGMNPVGSANYNSVFERGFSGEESEDSAYYNPEAGVFAVFDGAGGMVGGAEASRTARDVLARIAENNDLVSAVDIGDALIAANYAVTRNRSAGHSTAVVGKIERGRDGAKLIYASIGDSRIYVVRNGMTKLLTKDEGYRNIITNSLGSDYCKVKQKGEFPLHDGDRIVFCSDGITGDVAEDFIPEGEFAEIVGRAKNAEIAAQALVARATKEDDRTAIVVEV